MPGFEPCAVIITLCYASSPESPPHSITAHCTLFHKAPLCGLSPCSAPCHYRDFPVTHSPIMSPGLDRSHPPCFVDNTNALLCRSQGLDWKRLRWIHFRAICQQSTRLRSRENCCSIVGERLEYMGSLLGRQSTWPCAWSSTWQSTSPALSPSHRYLRAQWTPLGRTALANPCIERQCASTPSCLCCAVLCSVPPHTTCLLCCFLRLLCYVLLLRVCCTTFYASCVVVFCLYVPLV